MTESQQSKLAAIEAMWETEPAPAGFNLLAWPNEARQANDWELKLPYALGLIATRSTSKEIPGIKEIREGNRHRIESGIHAVIGLERLRKNAQDAEARTLFETHKADLGYGLLLKKYAPDVAQATPAQIAQAAHDTVPHVAPLFWGFRLMVVLGFSFALLFTLSFWYSLKDTFATKTWLSALGCVMDSPALGRQRNGLAGGRVRPPTMEHLRRLANPSLGLDPVGRQPLRLARRLHRLLYSNT